MSLASTTVGFIGTGKMATALAAGFAAEMIPPNHIYGTNPSEPNRLAFAAAVGKGVNVSDNTDWFAKADLIFLCVKPQKMDSVLKSLLPLWKPNQVAVSVAAGLTIDWFTQRLPQDQPLVRVMPNTPSLVQVGAAGISRSHTATEEQEDSICELLQTVGVVERVTEPLLNAVTGLSGSGPAYLFQIIEALSDGGVKMGLPRSTATRLAAQTVAGAAAMVLQTGEHPAVLKDAVTSPGGTTIAALNVMEQAGVRAAMMDAVARSAERSEELSKALS